MDIVIVLTEKCVCKRQVISVTGRCGICIKEGSEAFWLYMDGKITFPSFMRRLRKHG
jgi:hypothetical protein